METSFEDAVEAVRLAMEEIPPEHKVGMAIRGVFSAMDELIALANDHETRALVCDEKRAIGQLMTRCEVLCTFALGVKPAPTLVRNRSAFNG